MAKLQGREGAKKEESIPFRSSRLSEDKVGGAIDPIRSLAETTFVIGDSLSHVLADKTGVVLRCGPMWSLMVM